MNRIVCAFLICVCAVCSLSAQDLSPEQSALKSDIVTFLTDEGLSVSEDSSGDVRFNYFGHDFLLHISRVDKKPFYIVLSESFKGNANFSESEQCTLVNGLNNNDAVKVVYKDGRISFREELFVEDVSQFTSFFKRYMSIFNNLHSDYDEALKSFEKEGEKVTSAVIGVTLNKTTLSLNVGSGETLVATVTPSIASNKEVSWSSSNTGVATVNSNGEVTAIAKGFATIMVKTVDGSKTATCDLKVNGFCPAGAVDLGLSVNWATCNLGASKPEEYGDYYAWGATEPWYKDGYAQSSSPQWKSGKRAGYNWTNCPFAVGKINYDLLVSYWAVHKSECVDANNILLPANDVAHVKLGGNWRMPTKEEFDELKANCSWTWTTLHGVNGYKVQSKRPGYTDKWIFLPAAGRRFYKRLDFVGINGSYWSSSVRTEDIFCGWELFFRLGYADVGYNSRDIGESIRPVTE